MGGFENYGSVGIDVGVNLGLVLVGDGGDGLGSFAVHEPGHEVDAVAAEVVEGAGAVLLRVGEPLEEFWLNVDLLWAFVAVVDDDAADIADTVVADLVVCFAVAGIPGGLVVHEDVDLLLASDAADGLGIFKRDGERLLDHHGDAVLRGNFDGGTVLGNGGVDEDSVGAGALDHVGFGFVENLVRQRELLAVFRAEAGICIGDADELYVLMLRKLREEAGDMAVLEANDGDFQWSGLLCVDRHDDRGKQRERKQNIYATHFSGNLRNQPIVQIRTLKT